MYAMFECVLMYMECSALSVLHRSIGVGKTRRIAYSFTPCYPRHLHATSPSCGDVLQVGVGGGLLKSTGSHASV